MRMRHPVFSETMNLRLATDPGYLTGNNDGAKFSQTSVLLPVLLSTEWIISRYFTFFSFVRHSGLFQFST